jgi:hypothetical protein
LRQDVVLVIGLIEFCPQLLDFFRWIHNR